MLADVGGSTDGDMRNRHTRNILKVGRALEDGEPDREDPLNGLDFSSLHCVMDGPGWFCVVDQVGKMAKYWQT